MTSKYIPLQSQLRSSKWQNVHVTFKFHLKVVSKVKNSLTKRCMMGVNSNCPLPFLLFEACSFYCLVAVMCNNLINFTFIIHYAQIIDLLLFGCCTRFSCTQIKWCSQLAKPTTFTTSLLLDERTGQLMRFMVSSKIDDKFPSSIYPLSS